MGVLGWRWGLRRSREEDSDEEVETVSRGTSDSDWIVMGRAKREVSERKEEKASWRVWEAA